MRRGQRLAQERQYGRPRSFAEIVNDEPALQALTRRATMRQRKGDIWQRIETWSAWLVVVIILLVLALIFTPMLWPAIRR